MRLSGVGLELIKSFEGFRARATQLSNGRWMLGYGHTASAREGVRITRTDEFEAQLLAAIARPRGTLIEVMLDPEVITTRGTLSAIRETARRK